MDKTLEDIIRLGAGALLNRAQASPHSIPIDALLNYARERAAAQMPQPGQDQQQQMPQTLMPWAQIMPWYAPRNIMQRMM